MQAAKTIPALLVLSTLILTVGGPLSAQDDETRHWQVETVYRFAGFSSSAIDSDGNIHISFTDNLMGDLVYGKRGPDGWEFTTLENGTHVGEFTSISLDTQGRPHIIYIRNSTSMCRFDRELMYARMDRDGWHFQQIAWRANIAGPRSIALDSQDRPHVVFYNYTQELNEFGWYDRHPDDLKMGIGTTDGWKIETVDSNGTVGSGASLALGPDDVPHISYVDPYLGKLKYAVFRGSWGITTLENGMGIYHYTHLELDDNARPHVLYYNGQLNCKYHRDGGWSTLTLPPERGIGVYPSMAFGPDGTHHISCLDTNAKDLHYMADTEGDWQGVTVDMEDNVGLNTNIVMDSSGQPHIFYDLIWPKGELRHAFLSTDGYEPAMGENSSEEADWGFQATSILVLFMLFVMIIMLGIKLNRGAHAETGREGVRHPSMRPNQPYHRDRGSMPPRGSAPRRGSGPPGRNVPPRGGTRMFNPPPGQRPPPDRRPGFGRH